MRGIISWPLCSIDCVDPDLLLILSVQERYMCPQACLFCISLSPFHTFILLIKESGSHAMIRVSAKKISSCKKAQAMNLGIQAKIEQLSRNERMSLSPWRYSVNAELFGSNFSFKAWKWTSIRNDNAQRVSETSLCGVAEIFHRKLCSAWPTAAVLFSS